MENIHAYHNNSADAAATFGPQETVILQISAAFVLTIFILIAVTGNILVCTAIVTDRHLRHIGNVFTFSLAVADLLVGLIVMPLALFNDLLGYWSLPRLLCGIWISFDVMGTTASILNLCAISLDRYIHIKDPLHYSATITAKVVVPAVVMLWILSTLISFVPIHMGWHRPLPQLSASPNIPSRSAAVDEPGQLTTWTSHDNLSATTMMSAATGGVSLAEEGRATPEFQCVLDINPVYAVTSSVISFYFPCLIMLVIYTRLYLEAQRHVKAVKQMTHTVFYNNCSSSALTSNTRNGTLSSDSNAHTRLISEHKAAVTLGVIVSVFLVCWAPFFAINIIHANCRCISNITFKALTWLGYCNSAFNPIIYSIFNQDFRKAFRKLLHFYVCCDNAEAAARERERAYSEASVPRTPTSRNHATR